MFSKLSLTISAALFFAVAGGAARAATMPTNAEISAGESGNPDSIAYSTRMISRHSPSNEEIDAAEIFSPDSLDYRNHMVEPTRGSWQDTWQDLESGTPDFR